MTERNGVSETPRKHWRTLAELQDTPEVRALREREFLTPSEEPTEIPSRREFLKLIGAGAAFAAAGCARKPVEKILPYIRTPEEIIPGKAVYYASTCGECPASCGILVKTREGRPIKLEGMKEHPLNRGGLCARGQASLLNLYDPDRLKGPVAVDRSTGAAKATTWGALDVRVTRRLRGLGQTGGKVVLLTGTMTSPTTKALVADFLASVPSGSHVVYDAVSSDSIAKAREISHGERLIPRYRLDRADLIVTLGADPLGTFLSPVEFARDFASRRRPESGSMSKLVAIEPILTLTGTNADVRHRVRPEHMLGVALALANELHVRNPRASLSGNAAVTGALRDHPAPSVETAAGLPAGTLTALADELWANRGKSLVLAGPQIAPAPHAVLLQVVVNLLNAALGNDGVTVDASTPSLQAQGSEEDVLSLVDRMNAGDVQVLLIHGVNPAYSLPDALHFGAALARVPLVVSFADRVDETARHADFVAPDHHYLENWNDHEPRRGVRSLAQPSIAPLYDTRAFQDTLLSWARAIGVGPLATLTGTWHDYLRESWRKDVYPKSNAAAEFDLFWEGALREGVMETKGAGNGTAAASFRPAALGGLPAAGSPPATGDALSLVLYTPVTLYDGRSGNNAWLQELPDPVSKIDWDNYVSIAPSRAKALGISDYEMRADVVTVDVGHAKFDLPVHVQPGLHPDVIAIAVGYGRTAAGRVGNKVGQNAFNAVQATGGRFGWSGMPARLLKTGRQTPLACVQGHQYTEDRPIVFETTFASYLKDPSSGKEEPASQPSMWTPHKYPGYRWGLGIDMNACIGCAACMIACQVENNVPVVGKSIVLRGREMHWLRIDRYYSGSPESPETSHQPMLCQHCENAPCETVCPVLATVHNSEGLNVQIYNRCVGTRYCSNNCPYKVRRFNWFDYSSIREKSLRLALNPDLTVRSKGVMEKCTLCIQRIRDGKEKAKALGVTVKDGDIETACSQSCPTQAITFGNINDPQSLVSEMHKRPRAYHVLYDLNTRPVVAYQVKVRNREEVGA